MCIVGSRQLPKPRLVIPWSLPSALDHASPSRQGSSAGVVGGRAGGGSGVSAFKHLNHEFVVVQGPQPDGVAYMPSQEYIVDPRFREQFDIPQARHPPTPLPPAISWLIASSSCR